MGFFPSLRAWRLVREDTMEEVEGDFEAVDLTEDVGATYSETFALNSDQPITQFLHGNVDTVSLTVRLFDDSILPIAVLTRLKLIKVVEKLDKLKEWVKKIENLGRPPVVIFSAGSGEVSQKSTIASLAGIRYDPLNFTGDVRGVVFVLNLRRFIPFDIQGAATAPPETRFHRVKTGEYFELIAQREYRRPLVGDIIRKRHPTKQSLSEAEIIKLPSFAAIRKERVIPTSVPLRGLSTAKTSPQRDLRQFHLDRLNRTFISHIIPEGL